MTGPQLQFLDVGRGDDARRIAYLEQAGEGPGIVWMQGFKSDMVSTKASELQAWAEATGAPLLRFDYSGHGQSSGRFEEGTITRWLEESEAVFRKISTGPQIVVGSSMGGYLALLLVRKLMDSDPAAAARIGGLVLIAPAWNMTEDLMWKAFDADIRAQILQAGFWLRPSSYGEPYPITRALIEDGRRHLLAREAWDPGRKVVILQGGADPDVPIAHVRELAGLLAGDRVDMVEIADGDHRLARPEDIALLLARIEVLRVKD